MSNQCNCPDRSKGKYSKTCGVHRPASKAGERVEVFHDNKTIFGVLKSVRAGKTSIILDGGKQKMNGSLAGVFLSAEPLPKDRPTKMDRWTVVGYKEQRGGEETPRFNCKIAFDGVAVITADNDGRGGANSYTPIKPENRKMVAQLDQDAKDWCSEFGYPDPTEVTDIWFEWAADGKAYGLTAEKYIGDMGKQMAEADKGRKEMEERENADREAALAAAKAAGMTQLVGEKLELPKRFRFLEGAGWWIPSYLIDTETGRGVALGIQDRLGAVRALSQLFGDVK